LKWGDEVEKLEEEGEGTKTIVEVRTNDKGEKVKVTRTVKVYKTVRRVNKRVEERRKRWKKFGKCAGSTGPEPGISSVAEPQLFILGEDARRQKEIEEKLRRDEKAMQAMYKSVVAEAVSPGSGAQAGLWRPKWRDAGAPPSSTSAVGSSAATAGGPARYVPVHLRGRVGGADAGRTLSRDESATLRVSNLSEDATETDLDRLFRPYGGVQRLFLARDKETGRSKGFAFVSFYTRRDAQAAMKAVDGVGFDSLIISVEWAEDKKPY